MMRMQVMYRKGVGPLGGSAAHAAYKVQIRRLHKSDGGKEPK